MEGSRVALRQTPAKCRRRKSRNRNDEQRQLLTQYIDGVLKPGR